MKLITYGTTLLIAVSTLFAQVNKKDSALTKYINTFNNSKHISKTKIPEVINKHRNEIENYSNLDIKTMALQQYIEDLPIKEYLKIIEKREKAYGDDLYKPHEFWMKHDEEVNNKFIKDSIRFGIFEGILSNHLSRLYGDAVRQLILSPALLKVKIKSIYNETYKHDERLSLGRVIISAEIQDIIKGENHFNVGEIIKFYYFPFWKKSSNNIKEDESLFISLVPVIDNVHGNRELALDINEINDGVVKISSNILFDDKNYYGLGRITWEDFKEKITNLINLKMLRGE